MRAKPIHPSEYFKKAIKGFTQTEIADKLGLSRLTVNQLCQEKRCFTPETALRCAKAFGTTPAFWLRLQITHDIWVAEHAVNVSQIKLIEKLKLTKKERVR